MTDPTSTDSTPTPRSTATVEAIQAVVDRVAAYQESAPDGTVEAELGKAFGEAGVEVDEDSRTRLARAIEDGGDVDVATVLS
ncbi:MAG: hypothetical protein ACXVEJ_07320 [Nocardioides sp.]